MPQVFTFPNKLTATKKHRYEECESEDLVWQWQTRFVKGDLTQECVLVCLCVCVCVSTRGLRLCVVCVPADNHSSEKRFTVKPFRSQYVSDLEKRKLQSYLV